MSSTKGAGHRLPGRSGAGAALARSALRGRLTEAKRSGSLSTATPTEKYCVSVPTGLLVLSSLADHLPESLFKRLSDDVFFERNVRGQRRISTDPRL
jgi:hypothetical protein